MIVKDFVIVGGGIVGLQVANILKNKFPKASILILEYANSISTQASGRNSSVIHSPVYYKEDSLKFKFCKEGNTWLTSFCEEHKLPLEKLGEIICLTYPERKPFYDEIYNRAMRNNVLIEKLTSSEAVKLEPLINPELEYLLVPTTSVSNCNLVSDKLKQLTDVEYSFNYKVNTVFNNVINNEIEAGRIIITAGNGSLELAEKSGLDTENMFSIPFQGNYVITKGFPVKKLLYQVPDDKPFLGVHFTTLCDGTVKIGPTVNFSMSKFSPPVKKNETLRVLKDVSYLATANPELCFQGISSLRYNLKYFLYKEAKKLAPSLKYSNLLYFKEPGIRNQLIDQNGDFISDFKVVGNEKSVWGLNFPSPGYTSSRSIAEYVLSFLKL